MTLTIMDIVNLDEISKNTNIEKINLIVETDFIDTVFYIKDVTIPVKKVIANVYKIYKTDNNYNKELITTITKYFNEQGEFNPLEKYTEL